MERNLISGNARYGVVLGGPSTAGNIVAGNYIGTDITGNVAVGNESGGVLLSSCVDNVIDGNIISGNNAAGVHIHGAIRNTIASNLVGTDSTGSAPLGNDTSGVLIEYTATENTISDGNIIAFNNTDGVSINRDAVYIPSRNSVRQNSIHSNGALGIDLGGYYNEGVTPNDIGDTDTGQNELQNYPVIMSAIFDGTNTIVNGTLNSTTNTTFTIDIYGNTVGDPSGYGEGEIYLGTTTSLTDGTGNGTWTLDVAGDVTGLALSSTATDPAGNTSEFSAHQNNTPVADAGPDRSVYVNEVATLDGSGSSDPDGDPLTFSWTLTSRPTGSSATMNSTSATPTFIADVAGTYVASLVVNDGTIDSAPDMISISTVNRAPTANAGPAQTVFIGEVVVLVTLNGSGSSDPDGDQLTFSWAFTSLPVDSAAALSDPTSVNPTFTPDVGGSYIVSLIVNDGAVDSITATVTITVIDLFVVTNLNEFGDGSLAWTIANANNHPGPDIITFEVAGEINATRLALNDATGGTTIDGTTAPGYNGPPPW